MFALILTVLCLISVGYSDPDCDKLVQPFTDVDPQDILGGWALVTHSMNRSDTIPWIQGKDSVTVFFHNESYVVVSRVGDHCEYYYRQTHIEDHTFHVNLKSVNFTGTFHRSNTTKCTVLSIDIETPAGNEKDLFLFCKRRVIVDAELEEFKAQAKCLHMPVPVVMDPSKELCPETKEEVKADAPAAA